MKKLPLLLLFVASTTIPVFAATSTAAERQELAQAVANDSRDNPALFHHLKAVEIGAAVATQYFALADWRSHDQMQHGQVAFFMACDHWNVGPVSFGRPLTAREIATLPHYFAKPQGNELLAELAALETQHVAYLKPATPKAGC